MCIIHVTRQTYDIPARFQVGGEAPLNKEVDISGLEKAPCRKSVGRWLAEKNRCITGNEICILRFKHR